jgi:hypothetical protein
MFQSFKNTQTIRTRILILLSFFLTQTLWFLMGRKKSVGLSETSLFNYFKVGFGQFPSFGITNILLIVSFFLFMSKQGFIFKQVLFFILFQTIFFFFSASYFSATTGYIIECSFSIAAIYISIENLIASKLKNPRIAEAGLFGILSGISLSSQIRGFSLSFDNVTGSLTVFTIGVLFAEIAIAIFAYFFLILIFEKSDHLRKQIYIYLNIAIMITAAVLAVKQIFLN